VVLLPIHLLNIHFCIASLALTGHRFSLFVDERANTKTRSYLDDEGNENE
jgi:hypothetical protein